MNSKLKKHIAEILMFLKQPTDIHELTLYQIECRHEDMMALLKKFVEVSLNDKETQDGTNVDMWLEKDKLFLYSGGLGKPLSMNEFAMADLTKVDDFVNYMLDANA